MDPTRSDLQNYNFFYIYWKINVIFLWFMLIFIWIWHDFLWFFVSRITNLDPCHDTDPDAGGPKWYGYLTLYSRIKHAMTHKEKRYICNQCNYRCVQVPFCVHVPYCVQLPFCVQVPCAGISQVTLELHWLQRYRFVMCFSRPKSAAACHSKVLSLHPRMLFIERLI